MSIWSSQYDGFFHVFDVVILLNRYVGYVGHQGQVRGKQWDKNVLPKLS